MADNFGLKIGLEGEKEFKKALSDINQNFKVLGSEMKLVASQFDKTDDSVDALAAKNKVLNKEIDTQKQKIETLKSALKNAADSFGEADRRTQNWQVQLNNAEAALNDMQRELSQNNSALEKAENGFDDVGDKADKMGDDIEDAGKKADGAGNKMQKLGTICKAVGAAMAVAFAAVATAAVSAGKALVNMTVEGAAYADSVLTESSVTGIATDKLQEYMYAAELVDVSTETLTRSMAKNIKSMKSAADGSKSMSEAYAALGVNVTDANGNLRNSEDVYWELIDALGNVENETERDALAMTILGKSAQELNPLIQAGAERMEELGEQAHKAGYVVSDEMLEAYGALDDQIQYLKVGATAAKNAMGTILLPMLTELATDGVGLLGEFTNGILDANGDISKISDVIGDILPKALDKIMEYVPEVLEIIGEVIGSLGQAITDHLPELLSSASKIVLSLLEGLTTALPQISEGAIQIIVSLVQGIIDNLPELTEAAITVITTLAAGLGEALPELIPSIVEAIVLIAATLIDNIDQILDAAFKIIEGLAEGLLKALPKLVDALPEIILAIVDFITENLPKILALGVELIVKLVAGLISAIPKLVQALPKIVSAILEGLGEAVKKVVDIGKNIVSGLWEGITSMGSWLGEKISGFFGGIVDGAKDLLGIHSPSTVFEGIGENMGLGVGKGFTSTMRDVEKDIKSSIPTEFDISTNLYGGVNFDRPQPTVTEIIRHTGTIRVEGVNDSGSLTNVVDIVIDRLRQEVRV